MALKMNEWMIEYRKVDWSSGKLEDLTFEDYHDRLAPLITGEINCPARCWLRAMDAKKAEELGI